MCKLVLQLVLVVVILKLWDFIIWWLFIWRRIWRIRRYQLDQNHTKRIVCMYLGMSNKSKGHKIKILFFEQIMGGFCFFFFWKRWWLESKLQWNSTSFRFLSIHSIKWQFPPVLRLSFNSHPNTLLIRLFKHFCSLFTLVFRHFFENFFVEFVCARPFVGLTLGPPTLLGLEQWDNNNSGIYSPE